MNDEASDKMAERVGELLREIRNERGFSLQELASKTGVSKLTLGKIERGEGNPTLSVIWKIANGLSIPITSLLSVEKGITVSRKGSGFKILSANEACQLEPMFNTSKHASFEVHRGFVQPLSCYEPEPHQHGVVEYLTVMSGRVIVKIEEETYELGPFDSIRFYGDCEHSYTNPDSTVAVLHFIMAYNVPDKSEWP